MVDSWGHISIALSAFQMLMVTRNLQLFRPPPSEHSKFEAPPISVLIPARDEVDSLPNLLASLKKQEGCPFEVVILDDDSSDDTVAAAIEFSREDSRFRVLGSTTLPSGWAGKQHACHLLSQLAKHDALLFLDADVVLTDSLALAKISSLLANHPAAMISGIPRQRTESWSEKMIIPLIHLVLLGYLPFWEMRRNRMPALGAACGQMVAVKKEDYIRVGGHSAVRHRLHDATALAAHFRKEGHLTDLFDATPLADCRMYNNAAEVFSGFAKNATEGMAKPSILPLWTLLLLGANVLPWLVLGLDGRASPLACWAVVFNILTYFLLGSRFQQSPDGILTRPLGVVCFLLVQWGALVGKWLGKKSEWKGRAYSRIHD